MRNGTLLAAVDLGSNSFRLEIGRHDHGQLERVEYLKETVRQGAGLDESRNLTVDAMDRGWACLARFAERLAGFAPDQVRAVATQTLREARNRDQFIDRAVQVLGFPIDVISGREEARLIYEGVAHLLPQSGERRLVADIGGRSTELIVGQHYDARVTESYRVGSVSWSTRYFPGGRVTEAAFERAVIAARAVLEDALGAYGREQWDVAYGSAGTIGAVADILQRAGMTDGSLTSTGLDWVRERLLAAGDVEKVRLDGLKDDRRPVLAGGLSVLRALFDLLAIDEMQPAAGALRHGVLHDMIEREEDGGADVRSTTVKRLCVNFQVDAAQAERVERVARHLFRQLRRGPAASSREDEHQLGWAARLHGIGALISHADAHKHGAYILENTDAPGFSQPELHRLALLVLGHRGKLRKLDADFHDASFVHQLMSLRLAVILCHARREPDLKGLSLHIDAEQVRLSLRRGWAQAWPQSAHLLREERLAWLRLPWSLVLE